MIKTFIIYVAPLILGLNLLASSPVSGGYHASLLTEFGMSKEDMMRYSRKVELFKQQWRHTSLVVPQKVNHIAGQLALGLEEIERFNLEETVSRPFDIAQQQMRNNQHL